MHLLDDVLNNEKTRLPIFTKDAVNNNSINPEKVITRLNKEYEYIKKEKYYEFFKTGKLKEPKDINNIKREFYDIYGEMPSKEILACYKHYNDLKSKAIKEINLELSTLSPEKAIEQIKSNIGINKPPNYPLPANTKINQESPVSIMEHYKQQERELLKELIKDPQAIKYIDRKTASMYEYILRKDSRLVTEVDTRDTKEVYKTMKMIESNLKNYSQEESEQARKSLTALKEIIKNQYQKKETLFEKRLQEILRRIEYILGDFIRQGRVLDPA